MIQTDRIVDLRSQDSGILLRTSIGTQRSLIESAKKFIRDKKFHPHIVLCEVSNENEIKSLISLLENSDIDFVFFREADIGNQITALSTEPICGKKRRIFKKFRLLKI